MTTKKSRVATPGTDALERIKRYHPEVSADRYDSDLIAIALLTLENLLSEGMTSHLASLTRVNGGYHLSNTQCDGKTVITPVSRSVPKGRVEVVDKISTSTLDSHVEYPASLAAGSDGFGDDMW